MLSISDAVLSKSNRIHFQLKYFIRMESCEKFREKRKNNKNMIIKQTRREYERRELTTKKGSLILMIVDGTIEFSPWICIGAIFSSKKKNITSTYNYKILGMINSKLNIQIIVLDMRTTSWQFIIDALVSYGLPGLFLSKTLFRYSFHLEEVVKT